MRYITLDVDEYLEILCGIEKLMRFTGTTLGCTIYLVDEDLYYPLTTFHKIIYN